MQLFICCGWRLLGHFIQTYGNPRHDHKDSQSLGHSILKIELRKAAMQYRVSFDKYEPVALRRRVDINSSVALLMHVGVASLLPRNEIQEQDRLVHCLSCETGINQGRRLFVWILVQQLRVSFFKGFVLVLHISLSSASWMCILTLFFVAPIRVINQQQIVVLKIILYKNFAP